MTGKYQKYDNSEKLSLIFARNPKKFRDGVTFLKVGCKRKGLSIRLEETHS